MNIVEETLSIPKPVECKVLVWFKNINNAASCVQSKFSLEVINGQF